METPIEKRDDTQSASASTSSFFFFFAVQRKRRKDSPARLSLEIHMTKSKTQKEHQVFNRKRRSVPRMVFPAQASGHP